MKLAALPLVLFGATYLLLAIGRIPGLALDRTGFAVLGARARPAPSSPFASKPNAATATMERTWAAFDTGDLDAARALCATGCQWDDRRRLVGMSGDADLVIASVRERLATGARLVERGVIGTGGERVALGLLLEGHGVG